jgi:hypothetical protein
VVDNQRIPADLHTEIKIVCEMMLKVHYFEPANWLWMAVSAPRVCRTKAARAALADAQSIASQFGFPRVAKWAAEILD